MHSSQLKNSYGDADSVTEIRRIEDDRDETGAGDSSIGNRDAEFGDESFL